MHDRGGQEAVSIGIQEMRLQISSGLQRKSGELSWSEVKGL